MLEQQTTDKPINTQVWGKWFKFNTCGDKQLVRMLEDAVRFCRAIELGKKPYWLSFLGTSGAGKTLLAKGIHRWVQTSRVLHSRINGYSNEIEYPDEFVYWPDLANQLQQGQGRAWCSDIAKCRQFVVLDDIGAIKDSTGFSTNQLSVLLGQRVGKWTVITANLDMAGISSQIDTRVASRMIRDGSQVVDVKVKDYSLRNIEN